MDEQRTRRIKLTEQANDRQATEREFNVHQKVSVWMRSTIVAESLDDAVVRALSGEGDDWSYQYETLDTTAFPDEIYVEPLAAGETEVKADEYAAERGLTIPKEGSE